LLYNLALKCYFAIELKTGAFKPQDVGQLSFYVTAVDKLIKREEDVSIQPLFRRSQK
jgi:hypothetical protein